MKVKKKLTRMTDGEPRYVSLVKRASTGIPFRVVKNAQEQEMNGLNLGDLSSVFSRTPAKKAAEPSIGAVVVQKTADLEAVKKALAAGGMKAEPVVVGETIVFPQVEGGEAGDLVKLSDGLALVVKDFTPYMMQGKSFHDRVGIEGFYSGLSIGCSALSGAFMDAVYGADSPKEALAAVHAVLADFNQYVEGIVEGLPEGAFTKSMSEVVKAAEPQKSPEPEAKEQTMKTDDKTQTPAAPTETPKVETQKTAETPAAPPAPAATPAPEATKVETQKAAPQVDLAAEFAKVTALIQKQGEEHAKQIEAVRAEFKESVTKSAAELEKKISGTVVTPPPPTDAPSKETAQKSAAEKDPFEGLTDTGRMPLKR